MYKGSIVKQENKQGKETQQERGTLNIVSEKEKRDGRAYQNERAMKICEGRELQSIWGRDCRNWAEFWAQ